MSEYEERDVIGQGDVYIKHVGAMTEEGLHRKAAIAAELAHRDILIAKLETENAELKDSFINLKDRLDNGIKYDKELNVYIVVWTEREIEQAKKEADEIWNKLFKATNEESKES